MRVSINGFKILMGGGIPISEFMDHLNLLRDNPTKYKGMYRRTFIIQDAEYIYGLFVTMDDRHKLATLLNENGNFKIDFHSIGPDRNKMEFNIFIISKGSHKGAYLCYRSSCSANVFMLFARSIYREYRKNKIELDLSVNNQSKASIHRKYKGTLSYELFMNGRTFVEMLNELQRIDEIDLGFLVFPHFQDQGMRLLTNGAKSQRMSVTYNRKDPVRVLRQRWHSLVGLLTSLSSGNKLKTARVVERRPDGLDKIVSYSECLQSFGDYEWDAIADQLQGINPDSIADLPLVEEMKGVLTTNALFR